VKKITFLVLIFIISLILIGCDSDPEGTFLKITNNSDYSFLNVKFIRSWDKGIFNYGNLPSKSSNTIVLWEYGGISYDDSTGTISFNLVTTSGNTITCNWVILIKSYKNEFVFDNETIVNYSNNKSDTIKDLGGLPKTATFTINNMTDYNFSNVEYDSVDFGNINSGKDNKKNVSVGTKFIYFNLMLKIGSVRCRTEPFTCEKGSNSIIITNNTIVTIVGEGTTDTIKNIYNTTINIADPYKTTTSTKNNMINYSLKI